MPKQTNKIDREEHAEQKVIIERLGNLISENKIEHDKIIAQTTRINGTIASIQRWRFMITGGLIVINLIIVPILVWLIKETLTN